jgi:integrase
LLEVIVNSGEALPNIRLHDLRHTAGTMMLQRKMPVEDVSRILGHASISITLDVYRHVPVREVRLERVDVFDQPLPVREVPMIVFN